MNVKNNQNNDCSLLDYQDNLMRLIKEHSRFFVEDNIANPKPKDYIYIESAMMIGALLARVN